MCILTKDNKGFSFVELMISILIIAIVAITLTFSVMKFSTTAKENIDLNNSVAIRAAVSVAVLDFMRDGYIIKNQGEYLIGSEETPFSAVQSVVAGIIGEEITLDEYILSVLGDHIPSPKGDSPYFKVTIQTTGSVTVTY